MTPAQVEQAARRRYNAESSTFWAQDELFKIIWEAEQQLAEEALCIEGKDTSVTTVAGTRIYSRPTGFIAIKRIEYNGNKLQHIDDRQDDLLTLNNSATSERGNSQFYWEWNESIYLRPIPDAAVVLTIYGYKEATLLTTSSVAMNTPSRCHAGIIDYVAALMASKDKDYSQYDRFMGRWDQAVAKAKAWTAKKKRTDGFAVVKDEESQSTTFLGAV